jgi:hypothetical protein
VDGVVEGRGNKHRVKTGIVRTEAVEVAEFHPVDGVSLLRREC